MVGTTPMRLPVERSWSAARSISAIEVMISRLILDDFLSKSGLNKFYGKFCRFVVLVEDGIYLDQFQRRQLLRFGQQLHNQMCFPIIEAAFHRCPDTGCVHRINAVKIKTNMKKIYLSNLPQGFLNC